MPDFAGPRTHGARKVAGQRIVPTGIEDEDVGPALAPWCDARGRGAPFRIDRALASTRVDRHQVILAATLHSVARVKEKQPDAALLSAKSRTASSIAPLSRSRLSITSNQPPELLGYVCGIVARIFQPRRILVVGVADHQRNALGIGNAVLAAASNVRRKTTTYKEKRDIGTPQSAQAI